MQGGESGGRVRLWFRREETPRSVFRLELRPRSVQEPRVLVRTGIVESGRQFLKGDSAALDPFDGWQCLLPVVSHAFLPCVVYDEILLGVPKALLSPGGMPLFGGPVLRCGATFRCPCRT